MTQKYQDLDLDINFTNAVHLINTGPPKEDVTVSTKLRFYSLYKQATLGDCSGAQPWAVQVTERAKWTAWNNLKGMSKDEAKQLYIDLVTSPL